MAVVRECIEDLRQTRRLTFEEIGELAGASGRTAERWYRGEREPRFSQAMHLLDEAGWRIVNDEVVKEPLEAPQVIEADEEWRRRALRAELLLDRLLTDDADGRPHAAAGGQAVVREPMSCTMARQGLQREVLEALSKLEEVAEDILKEQEAQQNLTG